jgi:hypothetical protein
MELVDSPNSSASPRRYAVDVPLVKNLRSIFNRVFEVISDSNTP